MRTVDAARGRWQGVLQGLGIDPAFLRNRHGPCPMCEGRDRYRFDDKDGNGTWYCNQCGSGDGMSLAMHITGLKFAECAKRIDAMVQNIEITPPRQKRDPIPALLRMQESLAGMGGINPVRRYLKSRGLFPAPATRFCPRAKYWHEGQCIGEFPAMVHQVIGHDDKPLTWHLTYLTNEGRKAPVPSARKLMSASGPLAGGAIRLYRAEEILGIAEGVETAIAAHQIHRIPVWSCVSAGLLEQWIPPSCVKRVVIFADNDTSFTGQKSAYALAFRLKREGLHVSVRIPEKANTDFADEVQA
jgi:putative DNA primase/helicase